ncbi:hypothetical protein ACH4JS_08140 [Streptomyces sp. NPDC017638]|uniref:hypothetical protein n=1 Tax=Streptomyces sp. NPDC017638 TaxID=3365004 RepID=UPI00379A632F
MTVCERCGERRQRRPRSCSRCRSGADRADRAETTADVAEVVVETGLLRWVGRGVAGVARLVVRVLD